VAPSPADQAAPTADAPVASPAAGPVAIIGASGALGFGLALRLARGGVQIALGSRSQARAEETADHARREVARGSFAAHENAAAVAAAAIVVLSVPFRSQSDTLAEIKHALAPGKLVIDATVPLAAAVAGRATRMLGVWQGSAAQQTAELAPAGVGVVSALHTTSATSLRDLEHPLRQDVLICGDSPADKRTAAELIERIDGLRCVDCGPLEMARITESLTAMLIAVNARYKAHAGIRLTDLPEALWG
jgi:8-hydroxy-5-deazaflavin:NADPH oxidoreductase